MSRMQNILDKAERVLIPKSVHEELHLGPGDELELFAATNKSSQPVVYATATAAVKQMIPTDQELLFVLEVSGRCSMITLEG